MDETHGENTAAKLSAALSIIGAILAALTVVTAWILPSTSDYFTWSLMDFNVWIGRALWVAIILSLVGVLVGWTKTTGDEKVMRLVLVAGLAGLGFYGLDFKSKTEAHGRYSFSTDWTTPHLADWRAALSPIAGKPNLRALEVGTFEGRSAIWFLENILTDPSSSITCVDIFVGNYEQTFDKNIKPFGGRVTKIRAPSQIALRKLQLESYDFAYIDGSHMAKDVLVDAMLAWDLIKPGGIIIFDDYELDKPMDKFDGDAFHPKIAVDAFLNVMDPYVEVLFRGYQVAVRKRTEINQKSPQVRRG
jgi:hypothetical protein